MCYDPYLLATPEQPIGQSVAPGGVNAGEHPNAAEREALGVESLLPRRGIVRRQRRRFNHGVGRAAAPLDARVANIDDDVGGHAPTSAAAGDPWSSSTAARPRLASPCPVTA